MRLKTSATRQAIDKWKDRTNSEASRFYLSMGAIVSSVYPLQTGRRSFLAPALFSATMVHFAFSEFALLALLGFLTAKLHCYRILNSFLGLMAAARQPV